MFRRAEHVLAHAVYGLILAIATAGELLDHEVPAGESAAWLAASAVVLVGAHLFSDVLARVASTRNDPDWRTIAGITYHDGAVALGALAMASVMVVTALFELDSSDALLVCIVGGLVSLGGLTFYATLHHRRTIRLGLAAIAVSFALIIVVLESAI